MCIRDRFGSIPDLETETPRLKPIPGMVPDPSKMPEGCPFANRCSRAQEICKSKSPAVQQLGGQHTVRCHLAEGGKA